MYYKINEALNIDEVLDQRRRGIYDSAKKCKRASCKGKKFR